ANALDLCRGFCRNRKRDGSRLPFAWILTADEEVDLDARLSIPQGLARGKRFYISTALKRIVNSLQSVPCHQNIDIFSKAAKPVQKHRHRAGDRIVNLQFI